MTVALLPDVASRARTPADRVRPVTPVAWLPSQAPGRAEAGRSDLVRWGPAVQPASDPCDCHVQVTRRPVVGSRSSLPSPAGARRRIRRRRARPFLSGYACLLSSYPCLAGHRAVCTRITSGPRPPIVRDPRIDGMTGTSPPAAPRRPVGAGPVVPTFTTSARGSSPAPSRRLAGDDARGDAEARLDAADAALSAASATRVLARGPGGTWPCVRPIPLPHSPAARFRAHADLPLPDPPPLRSGPAQPCCNFRGDGHVAALTLRAGPRLGAILHVASVEAAGSSDHRGGSRDEWAAPSRRSG